MKTLVSFIFSLLFVPTSAFAGPDGVGYSIGGKVYMYQPGTATTLYARVSAVSRDAGKIYFQMQSYIISDSSSLTVFLGGVDDKKLCIDLTYDGELKKVFTKRSAYICGT